MEQKFRVPARNLSAFTDFVTLLKSKNAMSFFEQAPRTIFEKSTLDWVCIAFTWIKTPEGYNFWSDIDRDWMIKLEKNR